MPRSVCSQGEVAAHTALLSRPVHDLRAVSSQSFCKWSGGSHSRNALEVRPVRAGDDDVAALKERSE